MKFIARFIILLGAIGFLAFTSSASGCAIYSIASPVAVDGDTIKGDLLLDFGIKVHRLIRVTGIDTPELKGNGQRLIPACEKALAREAMLFTDAWLDANHPITISDVKPDKYSDRVDANVRGANGGLLASALLAAGHARPYTGGTRGPWCN